MLLNKHDLNVSLHKYRLKDKKKKRFKRKLYHYTNAHQNIHIRPAVCLLTHINYKFIYVSTI